MSVLANIHKKFGSLVQDNFLLTGCGRGERWILSVMPCFECLFPDLYCCTDIYTLDAYCAKPVDFRSFYTHPPDWQESLANAAR